LLIAGAGCNRLPPEQQLVRDAATALGGADRIQAIKSLTLEGEGTNGNLGQDMRPESTGQAFALTGYKRTIDVANGRARLEQTRTPNFSYFQGRMPQRQVQGVAGDVGFNVAPDGTATRIANAAARDRRVELLHHPLTIVRAALDPKARVANPRTEGNESSVEITTADGLVLTLAVDATTKLPLRVVSMTDNTNLGDVAIETSFADYQDVSGLRLPQRLTTKTDDYTTADIRVTSQTVDGDVGDLTAPPAAASAPPVSGVAPANVTVQEIAPGVWWLAGQSHHSVLVEFEDHLTLIEAPQHDTRTLAVIEKVKELRPNKPLTEVVNTHHHFDHSGGVRAAISQGLSVITHEANAAFFQEIAGRPHTLVPDALAKAPMAFKLQSVGEELVLEDASRTVHLYHIAGNPHGDGILMAYFPRERMLVEADVYTPGSAQQPYAANLLENIKSRNLRVDRIVPLHGAIGPYSDLVKAIPPATSN
jgi:glyoxylase-like metal-dependent hydrolase (beta-lactamase superfamily II)